MGRNIGPSCRLCRREGMKLFLKGARCETQKCAFLRKKYNPGIHGPKGSFGSKSEYSKQLREKQKAKRTYGIEERQFRNYYRTAVKRPGVTGHVFLGILESRLDNVLYRACFAESRNHGRQLVSHGLIKINGRKVRTPSILVKTGMIIEPTAKAVRGKAFVELAKKKLTAPKWLKVDLKKPSIEVVSMPDKDDIPQEINSQLIVELYSK